MRVDDGKAFPLTGLVGKKVIFGIRPEDITDALYVTHPNPDQQLDAKVEVVEPMGAEIFIYLSTGSHSFVARMNTSQPAEVNQSLTLVLNMKTTTSLMPKPVQPYKAPVLGDALHEVDLPYRICPDPGVV